MRKRVLLVLLGLFIAGCATADGRRNYWMLSTAQVRDFKAGVSTKADVERTLGKPHSAVVFPNLAEEAWDYGYMDGQIRMLAQYHFDMRGTYKYHDERFVGRSWRPYN